MWLLTVPGRDAELVGGLLDRQPEPVPQQHGLPLHERQRPGARRRARSAPRPGARLARGRIVPVQPRPLAAPGPAVLVDVGAHDDLPGVGLLAAVPPQPRPGDVQLHERGLEQVVGAVPVAADGVGDPPEVGLPGGDELAELGVPKAHRVVLVGESTRARPGTPRSSSPVGHRTLGSTRCCSYPGRGCVHHGTSATATARLGRRSSRRPRADVDAASRELRTARTEQDPLPSRRPPRRPAAIGVLRRGHVHRVVDLLPHDHVGAEHEPPSSVRVSPRRRCPVNGDARRRRRPPGASGSAAGSFGSACCRCPRCPAPSRRTSRRGRRAVATAVATPAIVRRRRTPRRPATSTSSTGRCAGPSPNDRSISSRSNIVSASPWIQSSLVDTDRAQDRLSLVSSRRQRAFLNQRRGRPRAGVSWAPARGPATLGPSTGRTVPEGPRDQLIPCGSPPAPALREIDLLLCAAVDEHAGGLEDLAVLLAGEGVGLALALGPAGAGLEQPGGQRVLPAWPRRS